MNNKNKKIIILIVVFLFLYLLGKILVYIDGKYGDTIPRVNYQQNYHFNKRIYNGYSSTKKVTIDVAYPDNNSDTFEISKAILTNIETTIKNNWKPYLKCNNEVIISLKNSGNFEYEIIGNTGPYKAADAARKAIKSIDVLGGGPSLGIYKFTVSDK